MENQEKINFKYFEMKINNDKLRIELNNDKITFLLTTEISYYKYIKEYYFDEIAKELNLFEYKDINNIFHKNYNYLIKNEFKIIKEEKIKIIINDKEIKLIEKPSTNDEIIKMLFNEIKNQNDKINELIRKNEDKDDKINKLEYKYNEIMDKINELNSLKKNEKNKIKLIYRAEISRKFNLFGDKFVQNNKDNIILYINGNKTILINEYKLEEGDKFSYY